MNGIAESVDRRTPFRLGNRDAWPAVGLKLHVASDVTHRAIPSAGAAANNNVLLVGVIHGEAATRKQVVANGLFARVVTGKRAK